MKRVNPAELPASQRLARPNGSRREARTEAILRAVLEEVAEVGYGALSVEDVAARVGIAKTTIYRRYPTKLELVRAAINQYLNEALGDPPNTGTFRGDLIALGLSAVQLATSVLGQSLMRTKLSGRLDPDLEQLGTQFEAERRQKQKVIATRAMARGEIASEADFECAADLLSQSLVFRVVFDRRSVDELEVTRRVDMLLHGIAPSAARHRAAAK